MVKGFTQSKFTLSSSNTSKGYTLIELTIVVGLVAILAIGISSVVLMNTVTANRTRNQTHVREVGDYAINQIKTMVRNSKTITSCDSTANTLTITNQDGDTTSLALELSGETNRIASGSANFLTPADIDITDFSLTCLPDETDPTLIKLNFSAQIAGNTSERTSPLLNFETSVNTRNN